MCRYGRLSVSDAACDCRSEFWFGWGTSVAVSGRMYTATQTHGCIAVEERVNAVDQYGRRTSKAQSFGLLS